MLPSSSIGTQSSSSVSSANSSQTPENDARAMVAAIKNYCLTNRGLSANARQTIGRTFKAIFSTPKYSPELRHELRQVLLSVRFSSPDTELFFRDIPDALPDEVEVTRILSLSDSKRTET
jgi:hypothetical protein